MDLDQGRIDELVLRPSESLNVEIKSWIDPGSPAGIAKIARAALALRNRNGGYLIIGFDDKTLQPVSTNRPGDIRSLFHPDKIQGIVSRYASELFEVAVAFGQRDGAEHPIIVIPEGIKTPVAAKADLVDGGKNLVRHGDVYFRTLNTNGTASTAVARPENWREIVEICFDNREADVGRFLRRHLAGRDMASLVKAFGQFNLAQSGPPPPTLRSRAEALLSEGDKHFAGALKALTPSKDEQVLLNAGSWSIALVIDPQHPARVPDQVFLNTLASANPNYTGWPAWLDSRSFADQRHAPKIIAKAWEALIVSAQGWSKHLDFMRLDPKGEFFLHRAMQDDASDKIAPGVVLDPILVTIRVAEVIAVGLAFAKALGWKEQETRLGFAFRWTKLNNRRLSTWANPMIFLGGGGTAHDSEITTFTELSLDTPISSIAPFVEQATQDLFALFDGYRMPSEATEEWTRRLIERRLSG